MTAVPAQPAVPDELVVRASEVYAIEVTQGRGHWGAMLDALAAVADDLRAEARRECAAELRAALAPYSKAIYLPQLRERLSGLVESWRQR